MLQTLKIKNVALIKEATINFDEKLNIISGETGAGKSVLLDALSLILGHKADKSLIKNGEDFLKVEATFVVKKENEEIKIFFQENDLEFDDCIIISRKISLDNKNEIKINGTTVPLSYLKLLAKNLVDIHLQNDNYIILNKEKQLELIDIFVNEDYESIKNLYKEISDINEKIKNFSFSEEERERKINLLSFQINEIENAKLSESEEQELENEKFLMKNAEKLNISANNLKEYFENSSGILSLLKKSENELQHVLNYNTKIEDLSNRFSSTLIDLEDEYDEIMESCNFDFDQNRFEEIDMRLDQYKSIHKKYGQSFEEINLFLSTSRQELEKLENLHEELENLHFIKNKKLKIAFEKCVDLTNKRKTASKKIEKELETQLKELSMKNAKVEFIFNSYDNLSFEKVFKPTGADDVEIYFSANLGENPKPLNLVASGGELARLTLAIKTLESEKNRIETIIFDEIDTGISGEASVSTSKKLARISRNCQILAISHLFQICAMADKNILVKKIEENGKTHSHVFELFGAETVSELCRFLSVNGITQNTINHANEVKKFCDDYKSSLS